MRSFGSRKRQLIKSVLLLAASFAALVGAATLYAASTPISYQGRLLEQGQPATGTYDLQFRITDAPTAGATVGPMLTNSLVSVSAGLFVVTLDVANSAFDGSKRWLEIGVRKSGSTAPYTILSPRQLLTAAPYAAHANTSATADYANNLASGVITSQQIDPATWQLMTNQSGISALNGLATNLTASGSFSGDASGLTNMPLMLSANTIWVSANRGNDATAAVGDINHPAQTLSGAFSLIQAACPTNGVIQTTPGDVYFLDGGQLPLQVGDQTVLSLYAYGTTITLTNNNATLLQIGEGSSFSQYGGTYVQPDTPYGTIVVPVDVRGPKTMYWKEVTIYGHTDCVINSWRSSVTSLDWQWHNCTFYSGWDCFVLNVPRANIASGRFNDVPVTNEVVLLDNCSFNVEYDPFFQGEFNGYCDAVTVQSGDITIKDCQFNVFNGPRLNDAIWTQNGLGSVTLIGGGWRQLEFYSDDY
jgi:hypothetical protein